jgi:hypothetical protein
MSRSFYVPVRFQPFQTRISRFIPIANGFPKLKASGELLPTLDPTHHIWYVFVVIVVFIVRILSFDTPVFITVFLAPVELAVDFYRNIYKKTREIER